MVPAGVKTDRQQCADLFVGILGTTLFGFVFEKDVFSYIEIKFNLK